MKYCLRWREFAPQMETADEIIIKYKRDSTSENLDTFVKKHPSQKIIVDIREAAPSVYPAGVTALLSVDDRNITPELYAAGVPYFFAETASSWDSFKGMLNLGVSEIRVSDELGFNLEKVSLLAHQQNVKIRAYCNIAQSSSIVPVEGFTSFYIRPEGVHCYEGIVDTLEFFSPLDREVTLYKIYKDEIWHGNLREIILNLNCDIRSDTIPTAFDIARLNCGKACNRDSCKLCTNIMSLAKTLDTNRLHFIEK